jgi:hypothetical protein
MVSGADQSSGALWSLSKVWMSWLYLPSLDVYGSRLMMVSMKVVVGTVPSPSHPIQWEAGKRVLKPSVGEGDDLVRLLFPSLMEIE